MNLPMVSLDRSQGYCSTWNKWQIHIAVLLHNGSSSSLHNARVSQAQLASLDQGFLTSGEMIVLISSSHVVTPASLLFFWVGLSSSALPNL